MSSRREAKLWMCFLVERNGGGGRGSDREMEEKGERGKRWREREREEVRRGGSKW